MLTIFGLEDERLLPVGRVEALPAGARAMWFDLVAPTPDEDRRVEDLLGVSVPTREEMQEIEVSSRLYVEHGALYMTALVQVGSETDEPTSSPITFILVGDRLATVRYDRPKSFDLYATRAERGLEGLIDGRGVLMGLLEIIVDRLADSLERTGGTIERISATVFRPRAEREKGLEEVITAIGRLGGTVGRTEECIVSLTRLFHYLGEENGAGRLDGPAKARLVTLEADARSLSDQAKSLDAKVNFLLSATLGLVGLEQNTIVKIFSVLAVVFMPPTLIASIYGMNFKAMPEIELPFGYPMALGMMLASVATTFAIFKWKRWL